MNFRTCALLTALTPVLLSTSPLSPQQTGQLRRVDDSQSLAPSEVSGSSGRTPVTMDWRAQLTDPDLDAREDAFDRIVREAHDSLPLRDDLRRWAQDPSDRELAWSSRLALREVERSAHGFALPPRGLTFDPFQISPRWTGGMQDFEKMFEDLRSRMGGAPGGTSHSESRGFRLERTPDGVRVEVQVEENGALETKTYEAESLDQLLEQQPELRQYVGGGTWQFAPGTSLRLDPGFMPLLPALTDEESWSNPFETKHAAVPTHILGIQAHDVAAGDGDGPGLFVERTVPGTIAHVMGVRRGDLLIELNGSVLTDGEQVAGILKRRAENEDVRVTLIRSGQTQVLTWRPAGKNAGDLEER